MIPILYENTETDFDNNGLGRLRDCISCVVTEERNGIYECDFEYPVNGIGYEKITLGRIIGVTHGEYTSSENKDVIGPLNDENSDLLTDENGISLSGNYTKTVTNRDVQPFDIVSCSRPINGVVTFHAQHISYRQSGITVSGTGINSLADAFTALETTTPTNPFTYQTDKASTGYCSAFDGVPRSVRSVLGGIEGSILDAYGGEYLWDKWSVSLLSARGKERNFTIRYGVNMLEYNEELDYSNSYTSVIPFWNSSGEIIVVGSQVSSGQSSYGNRDICIPLDLTDKFESQPTTTALEDMAESILANKEPYLPSQNITVDFIRLQDAAEYSQYKDLLECVLCDTIKVVFPMYNMSGTFKIVKTTWDVLQDRYESMELGNLSTSLSEALGISSTTTDGGVKYGATTSYQTQTITNDTVFTANYTGVAVCNLTTNSGQSMAPFVSFDIYNGSSYVGSLDTAWGITTSGAALTASATVQKGQSYRIHAVRCTISDFRIYTIT